MEAQESLYVTCRSCGSQVPTGMPLSGAVYEIPLDQPYQLICRNCGETATYTKAQFHILSKQRDSPPVRPDGLRSRDPTAPEE